jgi:hypothetical protein
MSVTTHRPRTLPLPRTPRTAPAPTITEPDDPAYRDVYRMLSEAAHLVTRSGREMRNAGQVQSGLALGGLADAIHAQIRQLPESACHPSTAGPIQHRHRSDSSDA